MTRPPVQVVGGGFAGAAAAARLADAGVPVVLWEARPAPGGRAGSFPDPDGDGLLDTGPHLLAGCYRHTRDLLRRLGTLDQAAFQPGLRLPLRVGQTDHALACPPLPGPLALAFGLLALRPLAWGARLQLLKAGSVLKDPADPPGTVADWLAGAGMPPAAVRLLWDPLCRAVMNLAPDEAAAAPFARALRLALLGGPAEAGLGWARRALGPLLGEALGRYLAARGGELRRGRVTGVVLDGATGRVRGLAAEGTTVAAERVVLAVDAFAVPALLPEAAPLVPLRVALAAMRPAPIVSTYLWLDRPALALPAGAPFAGLVPDGPGSPDAAAEWVFDRDRMAGSAAAPGPGQRLAVVASAADAVADLPADAVAARAGAALARHYPGMGQARVVRHKVVKERRATVRLVPGLVRPAPGPVPGVEGLFLCGDYTATGLPATIEGAAMSGEVAARAVPAV